MIEIAPTKDQIDQWIKKFVPEKDIFFIQEEDLLTFEKHLDHVLIIPRDEFFKHSTYNQIQLVNSYEYWMISKEAHYVLVANHDWIENLLMQQKKELFELQVRMGRGLVLPLSLFLDKNGIPKEYIVVDREERFVVLQHGMWRQLSYENKSQLIKRYAKEWDDWNCHEVPKQAPLHLKKYANTFSTLPGSNCLSATLFAISKSEWIIEEWVHPQTFERGLIRADYSLTKTDLCAGDVVVWKNSDGIIQHAAYHIESKLFFNKNGQTFFNPWKIVSWNDLNEEWKRYEINVYRKKK